MFIALLLGGLTAFFGVSGSTDRFQEAMEAWHRAVKKSVDDNERRDKALVIVESTADSLVAEEQELIRAYETFLAADRRFDASEADYELNAVRTENIWREVDRMLLEKREALHSLLTDAEWQAVLVRVGKASAKMEKQISRQLRKVEKNEHSTVP